MSKAEKIQRHPNESEKMFRSRKLECDLMKTRLVSLAAWSHKNEGTPETHAHAHRTRQGALARLHLSGGISADELAWATEIAMAAETIERDVAVRTASLETRVDFEGSARNALVEGIVRVRREVAYSHWRQWIPHPRRAVLDMITGEPKSFTAIAREYGMHKRRARQMLIEAIGMWPDAMKQAEDEVDDATLAAAHAGIL